MTDRFEGASFPLAALVLGIAAYLTLGLLTMDVPSTAGFPGPRFFPLIITVLAYVVALGIGIQSTRKLVHERSAAHTMPPAEPQKADSGMQTAAQEEAATHPQASSSADDDTEPPVHWRMVLTVTGSFIAFIALLPVLGWLLSAALLFYGVAAGLGARNHLTSALIALTMSAVVQLTFAGGLGLQLPTGIFGGL